MDAPFPLSTFYEYGIPRARKLPARQAIGNYRRTGGPQQASIAVRRRKTCVETRARTLGRDLPNDMRASMPELRSPYTEILPVPENHETKAVADLEISANRSSIRFAFV
jgi:hypothetical protein